MDIEISIALAITPAVNESAEMPRSMVPDPGWFDSNQMKFEDWWREIRLFLKSNRVNETDNKIIAILAYLRGGVAGIYTQKKLNELDENNDIQNWDDFVQEIKNMFSDKTKVADTKWKIETFKQGKRNTADFMIEFDALATKTDIDELHVIFLLKKNIQQDIIKMILGYPLIAMPKSLKEWKVAIMSVRQGYESMKGHHNYKIGTGMTYRGRG